MGLLGFENAVDGNRIALSGGSVRVTEECVGFDVSLFVASAMWVYPAPWRRKLLGTAAAFGTVTGLNWLRVVTLSLLVQGSRAAFDVSHTYVWPGAIIVACVAVFLLWIRALPRAGAAGGADAMPT